MSFIMDLRYNYVTTYAGSRFRFSDLTVLITLLSVSRRHRDLFSRMWRCYDVEPCYGLNCIDLVNSTSCANYPKWLA